MKDLTENKIDHVIVTSIGLVGLTVQAQYSLFSKDFTVEPCVAYGFETVPEIMDMVAALYERIEVEIASKLGVEQTDTAGEDEIPKGIGEI